MKIRKEIEIKTKSDKDRDKDHDQDLFESGLFQGTQGTHGRRMAKERPTSVWAVPRSKQVAHVRAIVERFAAVER